MAVSLGTETRDMAALFDQLLSASTSAHIEMLRMAIDGGLSQREIAQETGIPL